MRPENSKGDRKCQHRLQSRLAPVGDKRRVAMVLTHPSNSTAEESRGWKPR
jgi:hypothetical protein